MPKVLRESASSITGSRRKLAAALNVLEVAGMSRAASAHTSRAAASTTSITCGCARRRIALADLMNEPWTLAPAESGLGQLTAEAFRSCGLDHPRTTVVSPTPEVRMSLLATGRFL